MESVQCQVSKHLINQYFGLLFVNVGSFIEAENISIQMKGAL